MKQRCFNSNNAAFVNYGARGITVCEDWMKFPAFKAWAEANGYTDDMTLERDDVNRGYSPDNCRWIPATEQANNRRSTRWTSYAGETKSLREWSRDERCVVTYATLYARVVKNGWDMEDAMTTPAGERR